jgi:hypothetical protein
MLRMTIENTQVRACSRMDSLAKRSELVRTA